MAISYDDWKTQYEGLTTEQQKNYANMVKGNATAEEYANRYIQEKQNAGTFGQKTAASYTNANAPVTTTTTNQVTPTTNRQETPVTPVETPKQETPVITPTKQETPKQTEKVVTTDSNIKQEGALTPLSQDYYNQTSEDAQIKIINNLNGYKASNPEYFTDYESFKKNFSYDARNDVQKNTLDTWYKGYTSGLQLSGLTVTDLYTQYKNGSISSSELENLRVTNPEKYAELQNKINRGNIIAAYDDDNQTTGTMWEQLKNTWLQNMITNLNTSGSGASGIFDDYKDKMESPEMVSLGDEATEIQEQIDNVSADIDAMKKTVEAEYEGTGASRSKINAIIADRTYDLQLQLRTLNSQYNKVATQYNNRMQQYQNEFQLQLQEYQIGMQERNQKMNELGFAMDLMNFETNEQKQEREWNYWVRQQEYQNGDINSKDYSTRYKAALKSVESLLSQYQGIPMVRSAEQMAEDIIKGIDQNGTTLGEELSKINKLIQEKPEYKQLYNNTYGKGTGIQGTYNIGGTEYVMYNGQLITSSEFNNKYGKNSKAKAYDTVDEKVFENNPYSSRDYYTLGEFLAENKTQVGKKGGECAKFVNDYLEKIGVGRYFGTEDITTRASWANSSTPKEGTIAIFDYNNISEDGTNHGHVGIVTKVYEDGSFDIRESNFSKKNQGIIGERHINAGSTSLQGFFDPSKGAVSQSNTTTPTLNSVDEAKKQNYIEEAKRGRISQSDTVKIGDIAAQQGWANEWRDALNQGLNVNLTDTQLKRMDTADNTFKTNSVVKDFEDAAAQINILTSALNANNGAGDLAGIFTFMKVLDPSSVVRESEFESAAKTAGYSSPTALYQQYVKHGWDGTWLTEAQRGNFAQLAKELIKGRAELYQVKYNDLLRSYNNFGIGSDLAPTNMADYVLNQLGESTYQSTNTNSSSVWLPQWQSTTTGGGNMVSIGGYEYSSSWANA